MIKIGTDICSITRISEAHARFGERFLRRILTDHEIAYIRRDERHMLARLAGRFAAKEAASKALGTGWYGLDWKEVEVTHQDSGEPVLQFHGRAAAIAQSRGLSRCEVSISHEREFATAFVVCYSDWRPQ